MCFKSVLLLLTLGGARAVRWRQANPNNLRTVPLSSTTLLSVPIGLWNCQSAVTKQILFLSIATHSGLQPHGPNWDLDQTWGHAHSCSSLH